MITAPVQLSSMTAGRALVASGIGGVILYGSPPPPDFAGQLAAIRAADVSGLPLLVASDEEGGQIQRLAALTGALPWPRQMGTWTPAQVEAAARTVGERLRALGVNVDLAPVADLDAGPGPDAGHPDGLRSFSASASVATPDVLAFARGLLSAGVLPVVKHFPGIGTASANTDNASAWTAPLARLETADLRPFAAAIRAGLPAVMTSHAIVPGLSSGPVSLSSAATTGLLRRQLGFGGVVFTDSLSAAAIANAGVSVPRAAVDALRAGADDVLLGTGSDSPRTAAATAAAVQAALVAAADDGELSRAQLVSSVRRLAAAQHVATC